MECFTYDVNGCTGQKLLELIRKLLRTKWNPSSLHRFVINKQVNFEIKISSPGNETINFLSTSLSEAYSHEEVAEIIRKENYLLVKTWFLFTQLTDFQHRKPFYEKYVAAIIFESIQAEEALEIQEGENCYDIGNMTGEHLGCYLQELVDTKWKKGIFKFIINNKLCFTIKAAPTDLQPGNGEVSFPVIPSKSEGWRFYNSHSWQQLADVLRDKSFAEKRTKFLSECLVNQSFDDDCCAANVLLLFEIARRKEDEYPITRIETIHAINKAMKSFQYLTNAYENQVNISKRDKMLTSKLQSRGFNIWLGSSFFVPLKKAL